MAHRPDLTAAVRDEPPEDSAERGFRERPAAIAGGAVLIALAGVWAWWGAKYGGYFGEVMYPGIAALCLVVILIVQRPAPVGARLRLPTAARVALAALVGLGVWSALSALWSPSPDVAIADAQRIFGYAVAFALGIWLCTLLRTRLHLALAPLTFGALVAGSIALAEMGGAEETARFLNRGSLEYPLGYHNANAAFFLIALWPAVGLAASTRLAWPLRALALATATLCLELAFLSQSRGSVIAVGVALVAYLVLSRDRARAVSWLLLAIAPAAVMAPSLLDLYEVAREGGRVASIEGLHDAARNAALGAAIAAGLGAAAALAGRRISLSEGARVRRERATAIALAAVALACIGGFVIATGDPVRWTSDRVEEFQNEATPDLSGSSSRFSGARAGSERYDLWRVALADAGENPVLGDGAGGYHYSYNLNRRAAGPESVRDAHSVELEVLSELGAPGLILLLVALGAMALGCWRTRSMGASAAALSACALSAAAYWLAHSSIDWFWAYPGVTAPVFTLLGSACAARARLIPAGSARVRVAVAAAAALLIATMIAPYLSDRYVDGAFAVWREDPARAEADLDRARSLNPLSDTPLLAKGAIAKERGDREAAIAGFEEAVDVRPEEWAAHYFLAVLHKDSSPRRAREALDDAAALNPLSERVRDLRERISADAEGSG